MALWTLPVSPDALNALSRDTLVDQDSASRSPKSVRITCEGACQVDKRTRQPYGLLHGGASVALAETLGSIAAGLAVAGSGSYVVGLEINANHLRAAHDGFVIGTARPLHVGRSTQVWEIRIENEAGKLVCISRLTMAVVAKVP